MSVTVKYKGSAIAELTETGTKTLKTSGKYCEADIVVENTKDGGAAITDGIVVKARDAGGFPTEADVYGNTSTQQWETKVTQMATTPQVDTISTRVSTLESAGYLTLETLPKYGGESE